MYSDMKEIKEYIAKKAAMSNKNKVEKSSYNYTFSQQKVPGLPIEMTLPDGIKLMDEYSKKAKYPNENRPDIILTAPMDETVNFLYTRTGEKMDQDEIPGVIQGLQTVIKRLHGNGAFYQIDQVESKLSKIGWFDYTTAALDEDIYNILYVLCLDQTLLMGGFCCLHNCRSYWRPLVLPMLETITKKEAEEKVNECVAKDRVSRIW